jgi:GrpB-like predicted nucleotidyltransferase (UPF0157 family)
MTPSRSGPESSSRGMAGLDRGERTEIACSASLPEARSGLSVRVAMGSAKIDAMRLVREDKIRVRVADAFERTRTRLTALVPDARIEHLGSTAVPDSLTKGDLDICVIVATGDFDATTATLAGTYEIHQPENWTEEMASFIAPPEDGIEIGVELVVDESTEEDWFIGWRERLRSDPELRGRYDRLKQKHASGSVEDYRAAKERLILGS